MRPRRFGPVLAALPAVACGLSLPPPGAAPEPAAGQAPVCSTLDERLVVDWSPLDRAKLESAARHGLILLNVDGCAARIVEGCTSSRRYEYLGTSRQRETMLVKDADELAAKLPFGAARFGASVSSSNVLSVSMTVVGRYESPRETVGWEHLDGDCGDVTHIVSGVSLGSFEISSVAATALRGTAEVLFAGARAAREEERRHLDSAGVEARCQEAKRGDTEPPEDCAIPLRLELRKLGQRVGAGAPMAAVRPRARPSHDEIAAVVSATKREVAPCYRQALARDRELHGSLTLLFSVGRDGHVRSISSRHDVPDELASCALSRLEQVTFPASAETLPRSFVVPLEFRGATALRGP